jgi:hypothetical protein
MLAAAVSPLLVRGLAALASGRMVRPAAAARGSGTGLPEVDEATAALGGSLPHGSSARLSRLT